MATTNVSSINSGSLLTGSSGLGKKDYRLKISLADSSTNGYLYNDTTAPDIMKPIRDTNGVIFPYTPQINVTYSANYENYDVTHSNYKLHTYRNSSVDNISIIGDFTAQDTTEANYVLAVIHFFRSVTKMFYGKDSEPRNGSPPPLCYISGNGAYAFEKHPIAITNFVLNYPNDVDYINAGVITVNNNSLQNYTAPLVTRKARKEALRRSGLDSGGVAAARTPISNDNEITKIPTKMTISINAIPIVTRNDISNRFSLKAYGSGALIKKGIW